MFVARLGSGAIFGCWTVRQFAGQEELPDNNAEVLAFLAPKPPLTVDELEAQAKAAFNAGGPVDLFKLIKAVALWQAGLHAKTAALARDEIAAIYKGL